MAELLNALVDESESVKYSTYVRSLCHKAFELIHSTGNSLISAPSTAFRKHMIKTGLYIPFADDSLLVPPSVLREDAAARSRVKKALDKESDCYSQSVWVAGRFIWTDAYMHRLTFHFEIAVTCQDDPESPTMNEIEQSDDRILNISKIPTGDELWDLLVRFIYHDTLIEQTWQARRKLEVSSYDLFKECVKENVEKMPILKERDEFACSEHIPLASLYKDLV